jgi:hypothetical protein
MQHPIIDTADECNVGYPPAPWELSGQLWMGVFRLQAGAMPLPAGAKRLLGPRWLVLACIRYLDGVLRYDELAFGTLIVYNQRPGIWVDRIWVDNEQSLRGGRRLWGMPKELACFDWRGDMMTVADATGPIISVALNRGPVRMPPLPFIGPGIGQIDGQWVASRGQFRGRFGSSGLRIKAWNNRFPYRPAARPLFSFAAKPFQLHLPSAESLM